MMQEIIFWKNHPAIHDDRFHLAMEAYYRVRLVCDNPTPQTRIVSSGWSSETGVETQFLSDHRYPKQFIRQFISEHSEAIHILCGLRGCQSVKLALPHLFRLRQPRLVICQEAPTKTYGIRKILLDTVYRLLMARCRRKVGALFTMGTMGTESYRRLGFPTEKIYPTMYSYPGDYPPLGPPTLPSLPLKVIYVGDAVTAKGVPLLLETVKAFPSDSLRLTFVGNDPEGVLAKAGQLPEWSGRMSILGVIPNKEILNVLSEHDLLILPSFNDGWGMVVTEALIAGIGAIVTDACGSQDVPRTFKTGLVIASQSGPAIAEALEQAISNPELVLSWKINARARRDETRPEKMAESLHNILKDLFPPSAAER
jgi:glycosyltransferase involved in cell wall biosynthesis